MSSRTLQSIHLNKNKLLQIFGDDPEVLAMLNSRQESGYMDKLIKVLELTKGKDGYSPVIGKDFYTPEEIAAIKQEILNAATPNDERLLALIEPLIPESIPGEDGKPGKDADEAKITRRLLAAIPNPIKGDNGSPDTPLQIVEKLNTLESVIEIKTIKNLPDFDLYEKRIGSIEKSNTLNPKGKIDQRFHGAGLSKVSHDTTMTGDGTPSNPLIVVGGSPLTTKGDLYGFSTTNARLPVGSDAQILIADSSQPLGIKWGAAPAAGVTSVSNSDGTLTISPTTGAVVASRPAITGDVTIAGGSNAAVLPTVNSNVGTFQGLTINAKGQVTGATNQGYGTGTVTGATNTTLTLTGTTLGINLGNTNTWTANQTFNNELIIAPTTDATHGVIYQGASSLFHTYTPATDVSNLFFGKNAGNFSLTTVGAAGANIGIGEGALQNMTNGYYNFAIGNQAMNALTSGQSNIGIGFNVMKNTTSGRSNIVLVSYNGLAANTTGSNNFAAEEQALQSNTSGSGNIAIGQDSMRYNTTGGQNIAIGDYTLTNGTNTTANYAFGYGSMYVTTGSYNVGLGYGTLENQTSGNNNVAIGYKAGYGTAGNDSTLTDTNAVFIGSFATRDPSISNGVTLTNITAIGYGATVAASNSLVLGKVGTNVGIGSIIAPLAVLHLPAGTAAANTAPFKFTMSGSAVLSTPESGAVETDANNVYITKKTAIRESIPGVLFTQTADKTVTNTTTETSIVGTGVGGLTLPANFLAAGKTIRITMSGVYSTVAVTGDTVTIKVKYGSTVIGSVATTSLLAGATNLYFWAEALVTCRTAGATGTVQISGGVTYNISTVGGLAEDPMNNGAATTTVDTTASSLLDVSVTHSAANASNSVKSLVACFEVLN